MEYTSYNDLPYINISNDYKEVDIAVEVLINKDKEQKWNDIYDKITYIRSLNKHHNTIFNLYLPRLISILTEYSNDIRSNISKNVLMLIHEVFDNYSTDSNIDESIIDIIPITIKQIYNVKSFISNEASSALDIITEKFHSYDYLSLLLEEVKKSHMKVNLIFDFICKSIKDYPKEKLLYSFSWFDFIEKLIEIHNIKKDHISRKSYEILHVINNKFMNDIDNCQTDRIKLKKKSVFRSNKGEDSKEYKENDVKVNLNDLFSNSTVLIKLFHYIIEETYKEKKDMRKVNAFLENYRLYQVKTKDKLNKTNGYNKRLSIKEVISKDRQNKQDKFNVIPINENE